MKRDKLIPIVIGATAVGAVGALVASGGSVFGGGNALQPKGSHPAEWWTRGAEEGLWRFGASTAKQLATRQLERAGTAPSWYQIVGFCQEWFEVVDDDTLALMRREAAGDSNAKLVQPAIDAVGRFRRYTGETTAAHWTTPSARVSGAQLSEFRTQVTTLAAALDAAHYAIGKPAAAPSATDGWLDTALDVATLMNPIVLSQRIGAEVIGFTAGAASRAVGAAAGSALSAIGNAGRGLLLSPLGAIVIGGGVVLYLRGRK